MFQATSANAYDALGRSRYVRTRETDPRILRRIDRALDDAKTVVNIGAGSGSYEPMDRRVLAVDPSVAMLEQRTSDAAPAIIGRAETLPMLDHSVDAALAVLTIHHWQDPRKGLLEMKRVARERVVLFTWDPETLEQFWLLDYFPALAAGSRRFPRIEQLIEWAGPAVVEHVPVPYNCRDGFAAAFWRRPQAYLDADVRAGMSVFDGFGEDDVAAGTSRLEKDLESGDWMRRYGVALAGRRSLDLGYRLLIWRRSATT